MGFILSCCRGLFCGDYLVLFQGFLLGGLHRIVGIGALGNVQVDAYFGSWDPVFFVWYLAEAKTGKALWILNSLFGSLAWILDYIDAKL